ncbi:uncharacterized protein LOC141692260 isoform X1 [Apium graveolens]|uniref:uncharacterized protein LOC141692260 isoform X1 n=1 Tax=Apium graveolens TaxID=4045 RepID=UPI003D79A978
MAAKRRRNHTPLPWIAAIEALASNQTTPTSLLSVFVDLVNKIPGEFRENQGKNARELVCFRILESLSILEKGKSSDFLTRPGSSARVSPLDCCEHVLRQVQCKLSRGNQESEMSARDVEAFVRDKRSCLPKSALELLKDVILKESDLIPFSVKEMSGLLNKNHSARNAMRPERSDLDPIENPSVGDLSSGKMVMRDSATTNQEGSSSCKQLIVYKDPNITSLKRKQDAFCAEKVVEGKDSDSFSERRNVGDVHGAVFQHSVREESDLPREIQVDNLRETITFENVDYDRTASKKLKMSSTVGDAELLHNKLQGTCNVEKMTQGTAGKERGLNIRSDEAKKDCEGFVELETRGSSALFVNQGTKSVDGAKQNSEHSFSLTPDSVRCGEVKATLEHDQPETMGDDENDEILIRNSTILNSQHSHSQDSLATSNGTKKLCMVCNIGGQLLVCTYGSCQRVVHEKCMGVAPTFDAARSFYCPFCAYSKAISEYLESKKKYSLARRALVTFINREEYRMRNSSNISRRADQNILNESEICNKCVEQSRVENLVNSETEKSSSKNMRDKPSVSYDSSSRERTRNVTCGANEVVLEDKRNAERGSSVCFQSPSELEQQVPVLGAQNAETEISLHGGSEKLASVDKLQQVSHQPKSVALVENENKGEQHVASQAIPDCVIQNSKSQDMKIARGFKQHTGTEKEQDVSNQRPVLPSEPAKPTHSGVEKSSGEKKKSITHSSLRVRKKEPQYTYPSLPQLKRRKIPWSNAEVEALKAGVKRFASNHDTQMPWKTILEFGGDVFVNRTTIDLKDKWRNICKGSSEV